MNGSPIDRFREYLHSIQTEYWLAGLGGIVLLLLLVLVLSMLSGKFGSADNNETKTDTNGLKTVVTPLVVSNASTYCQELLTQGGFEMGLLGWNLSFPDQPVEYRPTYVRNPTFSGMLALQVGVTDEIHTPITNGVFQEVSIPSNAENVAFSFHYIPIHTAKPDDDLQFVDIIDLSSKKRIIRLWSQLAHRTSWNYVQFDLTPLRGKTIGLEFGVYNDGRDGITTLIVDDVSLVACSFEPLFVSTSLPGVVSNKKQDTVSQTSSGAPTRPPSSMYSTLDPNTSLHTPSPSISPSLRILPIPTLTAEFRVRPTPIPPPIPRIVIAGVFTSTTKGGLMDEYLALLNFSDSINIDGWSVSDLRGNRYIFRDIVFGGMSAIKLHSGVGQGTQTDLYWGKSDYIWSNGETQSAVLRDSTGTIVDTFIFPSHSSQRIK